MILQGNFIRTCFVLQIKYLSQLMRLWYLSHRQPAKAQASLRIHTVSPEPSLFARMEVDQKGPTKNQTSTPQDGCACTFEE